MTVRAAGLAIACSMLAGAPVSASPAKDRAALAQLEAAYAPIGKLAGAARTQEACSDTDKLRTALDALPEKDMSGTDLDDSAWYGLLINVSGSLYQLTDLCQAPGRKREIHRVGETGFDTADQATQDLDVAVHALLDGARPRDLPAAVQKFKTTLRATRPERATCTQQGKLRKLLPKLTLPAAADATKWQAKLAEIKASLDELRQFACGKPRGADDEITGSLVLVHDHFYELIQLVPPRS